MVRLLTQLAVAAMSAAAKRRAMIRPGVLEALDHVVIRQFYMTVRSWREIAEAIVRVKLGIDALANGTGAGLRFTSSSLLANGVRDRALIGLGFAGGFRRSELVALNVADLSFVTRGLEAIVRRSKTDQEGKGLTKNIARGTDPTTCPVHAIRDWLELAAIAEGAVFRPVDRHGNVKGTRLSAHAVALVLKRPIRHL